MDTVREELLLRIRQNFTTEIERKEIFVTTAGQYIDVETITDSLQCDSWVDLSSEILLKYHHIIAYLTYSAFRFYLPAWLTTMISKPHEVYALTESVTFYLIPRKPDTFLHARFIEHVEQFTIGEKETIASFFDSYFDLFPVDEWSYTNKQIKEILEASKYWSDKIDK